METNHDTDARETPAPAKLIAALRQTQSMHVFVPRTVDEAVLRASRQHFAPAKPPVQSSFAHWLRWAAFATACVLLCSVAYRLTRPGSSSNPGQAYAREDLNHDGRVDILDAFQLARQLQSGAKLAPGFDLNGDGVVDRRDAEIIAAHGVKLEKGKRS